MSTVQQLDKPKFEDESELQVEVTYYQNDRGSEIEENGDEKKDESGLKTPFGLYGHYFLQSFLKTFINGTTYAFLVQYLNTPSHIYKAARSSWHILWTFKFVFAILSDVVPLFGYRRKPYIIFGWVVVFLGLNVAFWVPYPRPYYEVSHANDSCERTESVGNSDAVDSVWIYTILLGLAKFGVAIMDCAADGRLVELTRRETAAARGSVVSYGHLMQKVGVFVTSLIVMVTLNLPEYGGDFCFGLSYRTLLLCFSLFPILAIVLTVVFITEDRIPSGESRNLKRWLSLLFNKLKESTSLRVAAFIFLYVFAYNFRSPATVRIQSKWAKVSPMTLAVFRVVSLFLHAIGIFVYRRFFIHTSWRYLACIGILFCMLPNLAVEYVVIFDHFRNQYFYFADDVLEAIPEGILYIIVMRIASEVCGDKLEGSLFAVLMSVYTLALPVSSSMSNFMGAFFDVSYDDRYLNDSANDRIVVFASVLVSCAVKVICLPVIYLLLPKQSSHLEELRKKGSNSTKNAVLFIVFCCSLLTYSTTVTILALNKNTSCLVVVGGRGC